DVCSTVGSGTSIQSSSLRLQSPTGSRLIPARRLRETCSLSNRNELDWILVPLPTVEQTSACLSCPSSPLLPKERDAATHAEVSETTSPSEIAGAMTKTTFSAAYH